MSFTGKHKRSITRGNDDPVFLEKTITEGAENNLSIVVADGVTDEAHEWHCDFSAMTSLFVSSDQDVLIETNNSASGSADDSWELKANQPIDWMEDDVMACPLTADVTMLYITNASGAAATIEIRELEDSTA